MIIAAAMIAYAAFNLLLDYHYVKADVYVAAIAMVALITGIFLAKKYGHRLAAPVAEKSAVDKLTARELQVLEQIADGKGNKQIAAENFVAVSTVKTHINNIYAKLAVKNRVDASVAYRQFVAGQNQPFLHPVRFEN